MPAITMIESKSILSPASGYIGASLSRSNERACSTVGAQYGQWLVEISVRDERE
jgi:hypothetical protein